MIQRPSSPVPVLLDRRARHIVHRLTKHMSVRANFVEPGEFFDARVDERRDILPRHPDRVQSEGTVRADSEGAGSWEGCVSNNVKSGVLKLRCVSEFSRDGVCRKLFASREAEGWDGTYRKTPA